MKIRLFPLVNNMCFPLAKLKCFKSNSLSMDDIRRSSSCHHINSDRARRKFDQLSSPLIKHAVRSTLSASCTPVTQHRQLRLSTTINLPIRPSNYEQINEKRQSLEIIKHGGFRRSEEPADETGQRKERPQQEIDGTGGETERPGRELFGGLLGENESPHPAEYYDKMIRKINEQITLAVSRNKSTCAVYGLGSDDEDDWC